MGWVYGNQEMSIYQNILGLLVMTLWNKEMTFQKKSQNLLSFMLVQATLPTVLIYWLMLKMFWMKQKLIPGSIKLIFSSIVFPRDKHDTEESRTDANYRLKNYCN